MLSHVVGGVYCSPCSTQCTNTKTVCCCRCCCVGGQLQLPQHQQEVLCLQRTQGCFPCKIVGTKLGGVRSLTAQCVCMCAWIQVGWNAPAAAAGVYQELLMLLLLSWCAGSVKSELCVCWVTPLQACLGGCRWFGPRFTTHLASAFTKAQVRATSAFGCCSSAQSLLLEGHITSAAR